MSRSLRSTRSTPVSAKGKAPLVETSDAATDSESEFEIESLSGSSDESQELDSEVEEAELVQETAAKRRKGNEGLATVVASELTRSVGSGGDPSASSVDLGQDSTLNDASSGPAVRPPKPKKKEKPVKVDFHVIHPDLKDVWKDLQDREAIDVSGQEQPARMIVRLLPFQLEGLKWMKEQETSEWHGGILADEMGMGKTIQMISLIVSNLTENSGPTLILTPAVAMLQWKSELDRRTVPGVVRALVFHGSDRIKKSGDLLKYNIILTTYSILEQGFRRQTYGAKKNGFLVKEKSLLHSISWDRLILDEAHAIKDRYCSTARACFALKSNYQWCLSGTPLQNRVGELFSLIRLLNIYPHSYYFCTKCPCKMQQWKFSHQSYCDECGHTGHQHFCYWNREILKPIQKYGASGDGLAAFSKLNSVLSRIMLRRTKTERNDELGLPPRIVECRRDTFNEAEEELYESLYSDSTRTFSTYVTAGTVLNNYASIFSLLSRMRLAANHPDLVVRKLTQPDSKFVCCLCHEEAEDPIVSACKHTFCREDARQYVQSAPGSSPQCPLCAKTLSIDLTQPEMERVDSKQIQTSIVNYIDLKNWRSSTKIEALVEELEALKSQDSTTKSLVFSQFVSFLDLVHWRLSRAGFNCVKLDGRMNPEQRAAIINSFSTDPAVTVFLISLKAGGIALNLTEASRVFVMDPWWNPAVEDQAMDRIHRLGQYRPIKITRMIIENSIESRIIELQQKKKALFDSTIGQDISSLSRLSEEDFRFLFVL
ncbi:hypothetical protein HDV03_003610 [Kappamyces sp. JEL0829]|nr:hypothetical protein HDV03_003610 [Kappamyces sp. JEL0829]